ncbi:MAG: prepilin-type N-terminal cleavage/methylation domain-containing protein [Eubacterium sp.]|nr:prepilin-type N-terminal cleavage/methylation domain-containing protein [Eubacterium sp.]
MKKRIQKYLSGEREGFSLVELIIVIAIMAILIGIVALAVIPYLEKSRVGKDQQTVDTVYSAFQSCVADQKITKDLTVSIPSSGTATATVGTGETATADTVLKFMADALNATGAADLYKSTSGKLESSSAKGSGITCTYTASTKEIKVVSDGDSTIKSSNK